MIRWKLQFVPYPEWDKEKKNSTIKLLYTSKAIWMQNKKWQEKGEGILVRKNFRGAKFYLQDLLSIWI